MFIKSVFRANLGKNSSFGKKILEGGGNRYKSIAQKFLAVGVSFSLAAAMVPQTGTFAAEDTPTIFYEAAKSNHWGRSDLRAYLNGVEKVDNTLPIDTTDAGSNDTGYASHFSDAEYAMVKPFRYRTHILSNADTATSTYDTADRFWLPSGNLTSNQVIGWGAADVSLNSTYADMSSSRAVPISFWSSGTSWLRSPNARSNNMSLAATRGDRAEYRDVCDSHATAALAKLDLSSVLFASAASATSYATVGGADTLAVLGSSSFTLRTPDALPSYGMYLKTESTDAFTATALSLSGSTLTVYYDDGVEGQYVVVHVFEGDSLTDGRTSYVAAGAVTSADDSVTLDVSAWIDDEGNRLANLDDYTIKVWMEDASKGASLAPATTPVTFVGSGGSITATDEGAVDNLRVFALAEDLQCSWGSLATKDALIGDGATYQKIYFGNYVDTADGDKVKPLEFWIAGREDYGTPTPSVLDGDGTLSSTGQVMTLYQAASITTCVFNSINSSYKTVPRLTLEDGKSVQYTGAAVEYPGGITYQKYDGTEISPQPAVSIQYSADNGETWTGDLPTAAGSYKVRGVAASTADYETATSQPVTFTISKATPSYQLRALETVNAIFGQTLNDLTCPGYELGLPQFNNRAFVVTIAGTWSWVDNSSSILDVGTHEVWAKFTPEDTTNFDWDNMDTSAFGENAQVENGVLQVKVNVNIQALPMDDGSIMLYKPGTTTAWEDVTYNGTEQKPDVVVKNGDATLTEGTDYDITWPNDCTTAGQKDITVMFKGNYASDDDGDGDADSPNNGVKLSYTIKKAQLTPSISAANKTYDGKSDADVEVTFTGLQNGETLTAGTDYDVAASFADANAGTGKTVTATVNLNTTDSANNYTLTSATATDTADIIPAELTVTLSSNDVTYGEDVEITAAAAGLVAGDELTAADTVKFTVNGTDYEASFDGTTATATIPAMAAGDYDVTATVALAGANATNYTVGTIDPITVIVDQKDVTVSADNKTKVEGESDPELTYAVDPTTPLVSGDVLTGALAREAGETAGTYAITQGTLTNASNPNYNITFNEGTFTITAKVDEEIFDDTTDTDDNTDNDPTIGDAAAPETGTDAKPMDTSGWGEVFYYNGLKHYVDSAGMTSVEITGNGIFWLKEESEGTSAWYGLDNSNGIFEPGSRFYVQWLNYKDHPEEFANIDDATLQIIEGDNGWLFKVGVIKPDGTRYATLPEKVNLYVQIGDDWDKDDLRAFYITQNNDESVEVDFADSLDYPEGLDTFGVMKLNHFSPYLIFDKVDETATKSENSLPTGDQVTYITISGLGLIMTLALGLMFKTNFGKRKFND